MEKNAEATEVSRSEILDTPDESVDENGNIITSLEYAETFAGFTKRTPVLFKIINKVFAQIMSNFKGVLGTISKATESATAAVNAIVPWFAPETTITFDPAPAADGYAVTMQRTGGFDSPAIFFAGESNNVNCSLNDLYKILSAHTGDGVRVTKSGSNILEFSLPSGYALAWDGSKKTVDGFSVITMTALSNKNDAVARAALFAGNNASSRPVIKGGEWFERYYNQQLETQIKTETDARSNGDKQTLAAAKEYAEGLCAALDYWVYKGTLGASGDVRALPTSGYSAGWNYRIATAGTYAGHNCEVSDIIICIHDFDTAAKDSDWSCLQTNIDGAVVGPASSNDGNIAVFNGESGKVIGDSGINVNDLRGTVVNLADVSFSKVLDSRGESYNYYSATISTDIRGKMFIMRPRVLGEDSPQQLSTYVDYGGKSYLLLGIDGKPMFMPDLCDKFMLCGICVSIDNAIIRCYPLPTISGISVERVYLPPIIGGYGAIAGQKEVITADIPASIDPKTIIGAEYRLITVSSEELQGEKRLFYGYWIDFKSKEITVSFEWEDAWSTSAEIEPYVEIRYIK